MTARDAYETKSEAAMNIKFSRRRFLTTSAGALGVIAMPHLSRAAD